MFDEPLVKLDCLAHYGDMRYHLILFTRLITNNISGQFKINDVIITAIVVITPILTNIYLFIYLSRPWIEFVIESQITDMKKMKIRRKQKQFVYD